MLCARCVLHKNALRTPSAVQKNELEPSLAYPVRLGFAATGQRLEW